MDFRFSWDAEQMKFTSPRANFTKRTARNSKLQAFPDQQSFQLVRLVRLTKKYFAAQISFILS